MPVVIIDILKHLSNNENKHLTFKLKIAKACKYYSLYIVKEEDDEDFWELLSKLIDFAPHGV